jgi:methyl-accepting chemotaxis protein
VSSMATFTPTSNRLSVRLATQKKAVASFADDVAQIAAIGKEGQNDSSKLAELADKVKTLTEQQLLATGIFILPQYRKAEVAIIAIANTPEIQSPGNSIDQSLQQHLRSLPYLELMYVTDANGIQISSNVSRQGQTISFDTATKGKNWSHRDWFRKVQETGSSYISEIYKSEATNSFCLTLTVPIIRHGSLVGVLGADINFEDLLSI